MNLITIKQKQYVVKQTEFKQCDIKELYPMIILDKLPELEKDIGFLKRLNIFSSNLICNNLSHGGYVCFGVVKNYTKISICSDSYYDMCNSEIEEYVEKLYCNNDKICFSNIAFEDSNSILYEIQDTTLDHYTNPVIINSQKLLYQENKYVEYKFNNKYVYVFTDYIDQFLSTFGKYISGYNINWDNLINVIIMVKNAGDDFKNILESNLPYMDCLTVLDTGSTDNTVQIVNDFLSTYNIEGKLYERKWKNFRDSRNELLELAGEDYDFNIMLDDTYVLNGNIRNFLQIARGDIAAESYSLFIKDDFLCYSSNRITRPTHKKLKYMYKIHEILEKNSNFEIPVIYGYITDVKSTYMNDRTNKRKEEDLKLLFEELEENPKNSRQLYYIAETYLCLKDWKNSYLYYKKRAETSNVGYHAEIQDSLYKMAVISYFNFNQVETSIKEFLDCYKFDTTKSESLYMIGYIYKHNYNTPQSEIQAYEYLKKAFEISKKYTNSTMNSKHKINKYDIPKILLPYCLKYKNYDLGYECAQLCNDYKDKTDSNDSMWLSLFYLCKGSQKYQNYPKTLLNNKKTICLIAPGGWDMWDGTTLENKGLGGSETFVIKYAEYLSKIYTTNYNIIVLCKCENSIVYNGVLYYKITNAIEFLSKYKIEHCFVNRYPEYLEICYQNNISNINIIFHDLFRRYEFIVDSSNLKHILCLSEWHKNQFLTIFPNFAQKTSYLSYGIEKHIQPKVNIIPYSFIFPSFPNRGLLPLLKIFPKIVEKYPKATLNVFCNLDLPWVQERFPEQMKIIKKLLQQPNVINHGWVSQTTLSQYWATSHVWLYPCIFEETYCRITLEAAISKTLVVTSNLGALTENVSDRGLIINGNANTKEWGEEAIGKLFDVLEDKNLYNQYISKNYQWAINKNYTNVVNNFNNKFILN
jgi:hypothetical protein